MRTTLTPPRGNTTAITKCNKTEVQENAVDSPLLTKRMKEKAKKVTGAAVQVQSSLTHTILSS